MMRKKIIIFVLFVISECINCGLIDGILNSAHEVHKKVHGTVLGGLSQAFNFNVHGQFGVNHKPNHGQQPGTYPQQQPNYEGQDRFPPNYNGQSDGQYIPDRPHNNGYNRPHHHQQNGYEQNVPNNGYYPNQFHGGQSGNNNYHKPGFGNNNHNGHRPEYNNHNYEDNFNGQPEYGNQNNYNTPQHGQNNNGGNQNNFGKPRPDFHSDNPSYNQNNHQTNDDLNQHNHENNGNNYKPNTENTPNHDNFNDTNHQNGNTIDKTTKKPDEPIFVPLKPNEYMYGGDKIQVTTPNKDVKDKPKSDEDDEYIDIRLKEE